MLRPLRLALAAVVLVVLQGSYALAQKPVETTINLVTATGIGKAIGVIRAYESKQGFLLLDLNLSDELPPGAHGFHVHENGDCGPGKSENATMAAGLAAGGHFDPLKTGKHEGPSGAGHLGDLPVLYVEIDEDGALELTHSMVLPRLRLVDILGRSLVIHSDGDNYSDEPKTLGGGGARIACGVIPK